MKEILTSYYDKLIVKEGDVDFDDEESREYYEKSENVF